MCSFTSEPPPVIKYPCNECCLTPLSDQCGLSDVPDPFVFANCFCLLSSNVIHQKNKISDFYVSLKIPLPQRSWTFRCCRLDHSMKSFEFLPFLFSFLPPLLGCIKMTGTSAFQALRLREASFTEIDHHFLYTEVPSMPLFAASFAFLFVIRYFHFPSFFESWSQCGSSFPSVFFLWIPASKWLACPRPGKMRSFFGPF